MFISPAYITFCLGNLAVRADFLTNLINTSFQTSLSKLKCKSFRCMLFVILPSCFGFTSLDNCLVFSQIILGLKGVVFQAWPFCAD